MAVTRPGSPWLITFGEIAIGVGLALRGPDRCRRVLRGPDEHVVPARGFGVDQPGPVHAGRRADAGLARRRLLRPRPLPAAGTRRAVAARHGIPSRRHRSASPRAESSARPVEQGPPAARRAVVLVLGELAMLRQAAPTVTDPFGVGQLADDEDRARRVPRDVFRHAAHHEPAEQAARVSTRRGSCRRALPRPPPTIDSPGSPVHTRKSTVTPRSRPRSTSALRDSLATVTHLVDASTEPPAGRPQLSRVDHADDEQGRIVPARQFEGPLGGEIRRGREVGGEQDRAAAVSAVGCGWGRHAARTSARVSCAASVTRSDLRPDMAGRLSRPASAACYAGQDE